MTLAVTEYFSSSSALTSSSRVSSLETSMRLTPSFASSLAKAYPIPLVGPVTIAYAGTFLREVMAVSLSARLLTIMIVSGFHRNPGSFYSAR